MKRQLKATVSGSFRRAMGAVSEAVYALTDAGVYVLSPADPRVVDQFGDFLFVASDRVRAIKLVQSRHLAAIAASDFVWLVAPQGYIGQSGALEIGYALSVGTPVFCSEVPTDLTLRQYAVVLPTPEDAAKEVRRRQREEERLQPRNILLDPKGTIDAAHKNLDSLLTNLTSGTPSPGEQAETLAKHLEIEVSRPLRTK